MNKVDLPLFYAPLIGSNDCLPEEEASHALRVLRLNVDNHILIADGKGTFYTAEITQIDRKLCRVLILDHHSHSTSWQGPLTIAIAPTKQMERMEWMCEKMVEIGIDHIVFLRTEHSERKQIRLERLKRIAISAMKQSLKATLPRIETEIRFADFVSRQALGTRLIAHCIADDDEACITMRKTHMHKLYGGGAATVMIGPEGDFSPNEIATATQSGYLPLSLGASRLRSETAAITALQWLHCIQTMTEEQ